MPTKLYLPNLLEFIYHTIVEKGVNYLFDRLDREDFLKVKTESKARIFAEFANLEDKIILMSKLGMGVGLVFWDKEKQKTKNVEDVVIAYIDTPSEADLTKQIIKDKTFCTRDIDFIKSLQTMSRSSMSKVYAINSRFLHIREGALKTRTLVNKLEAENNLEWYSKTVQFALDIESVLEPFKINIIQLRILLYLQNSQNGATKDVLQTKLERTNITGMINEMYDNNMVAFSMTNKNVVMIDVYGVMILEQIFSKFP